MSKFTNKSIKDILKLSQKEREEYLDILPERFFESMQFLNSLYKMENHFSKSLNEYNEDYLKRAYGRFPYAVEEYRKWIIIPKSKEMTFSFDKEIFFRIFKCNINHCQEHHLLMLTSIIAFLFEIGEDELILSISKEKTILITKNPTYEKDIKFPL